MRVQNVLCYGVLHLQIVHDNLHGCLHNCPQDPQEGRVFSFNAKPKLIPNTSVINTVSCLLHLLECFFFLKTWNQFTHIPHVAEAPYRWEHSGRIMRKVFQKLQPSHHRHTGTKEWLINLLTNSNTDCSQLTLPPEPSYKLQHQDSTHPSPYSTFCEDKNMFIFAEPFYF